MSGPVLIRGDQAITTKKDVAAGRESACLKDGVLTCWDTLFILRL